MTDPTTDSHKRRRASLVASLSILLAVLALLALLGTSLERSRAVSPAEALPPPAQPFPEGASPSEATDPKLAAHRAAKRVAFAADTQRPAPPIPSGDAAIRHPTVPRCAAYEDSLRDFLDDARRPCNRPGYTRAEDFSCVPDGASPRDGFFDNLLA